MKVTLLTLLLLFSRGAFAEGKADSDRNVLSAVLGAADAYLVPGNGTAVTFDLLGGTLSVALGGAAFADKTVHRGVGTGFASVGSALILSGLFGIAKTNRLAANEDAFLKSTFYDRLRKELGEAEARDFYQDLRAGVGIHRLVKTYSPGGTSVTFLAFFRQEQKAVAGLIPPDLTSRHHRLDLIDVIAARRAALRMVAQEASASERARIEEILARDLEQLRVAAAAAPGGAPPHPVPDSGSPKTHD